MVIHWCILDILLSTPTCFSDHLVHSLSPQTYKLFSFTLSLFHYHPSPLGCFIKIVWNAGGSIGMPWFPAGPVFFPCLSLSLGHCPRGRDLTWRNLERNRILTSNTTFELFKLFYAFFHLLKLKWYSISQDLSKLYKGFSYSYSQHACVRVCKLLLICFLGSKFVYSFCGIL